MYFVYVLQNERGGLYYGYTSDLRQRLAQHNSGRTRTTKDHQWSLVYYEAYAAKADALKRESQLKRFGQALAHLKTRLKHSLRQS